METEKVYQVDEKNFIQQGQKIEHLKNRIEEIIETSEAYTSTLYVLNKELENELLKSRLKSTSSGSSPRKNPPSKFNFIIT